MNNDPDYERIIERYRSGNVPWDDPLPPPEILEIISTLAPGRALDLGCGYGRAAIFMASNGWDVDAIDFIPEAITEARKRAAKAGVQIRFHVSRVTGLSFLTAKYDLAVDVGCCHNMNDVDLNQYGETLARLLRPGAIFLLYARLRTNNSEFIQQGPRGLHEATIVKIFQRSFNLLWIRRGETVVEDQPPWPSGWFQFQRC
jgi:SAM-dependent methyltransferase